jgi:signal transduction histidine kinase
VQPGQGIGLSVVAEPVSLYHRSLKIESSCLVGACLELELPVSARAQG